MKETKVFEKSKKPFNKSYVIKEDFKTEDIIKLLFDAFKEFPNQIDAEEFKKPTIQETSFEIWDFIKRNFKYIADGFKLQKVKLPSVLLESKTGDCKSFALFTASILKSLDIPFYFRFTSYNPDDDLPKHVYIVAIDENGNKVKIDACLPQFNAEKKFFYKYDFKFMPQDKKLVLMAGTDRLDVSTVNNCDFGEYIMCPDPMDACSNQSPLRPIKYMGVDCGCLKGHRTLLIVPRNYPQVGVIDDVLELGKEAVKFVGDAFKSIASIFGGNKDKQECWTLKQILTWDSQQNTMRLERATTAVAMGYATSSFDYNQKNAKMLAFLNSNPQLDYISNQQVCKGISDQAVIQALQALDKAVAQAQGMSYNNGYTPGSYTPGANVQNQNAGFDLQKWILPLGAFAFFAYKSGMFKS